MSRLCLAGAAAALLSGCPGDEDDPDGGPDPAGVCSTLPGKELQVGTSPPSGEGFLAFEDGEDVELATAGQGGYHLFLSYRIRGYDPMGLRVRRSVSFAANGDEITGNPELLNLRPPAVPDEESYCGLRSAQRAIVCSTILGRVWDAELRVDVTIEDARGEGASVTRYLRAVCPDGDDACLAICDGIPVEP